MDGHSLLLINGASPAPSITPGPTPGQQTPVPFTNDQIHALRAQIHAFKLISKGQTVPESVQRAIRVPNTAVADLEKVLQVPDVPSRIVDAAVKTAEGEPGTPTVTATILREGAINQRSWIFLLSTLPIIRRGPSSMTTLTHGFYPYNAYKHPFSHLKRPSDIDPQHLATRLQRLIIPTIMPADLDTHHIINECERFIEARIQQRIRELEAMPATMADGIFDPNVGATEDDDTEKENINTSATLESLKPFSALIHPSSIVHGKLRAVIELKSLRLLDKQRALRASVAEHLTHGTMLPLNRL
jgi:ATP-dependent helicase STH1/SNF2